MKIFWLNFLWFLCEEREREELIQQIKNSGKIKTDFFGHNMFLKPREQKQKTKDSFCSIFQQEQRSFLILQKKGESKRETVFKR